MRILVQGVYREKTGGEKRKQDGLEKKPSEAVASAEVWV